MSAKHYGFDRRRQCLDPNTAKVCRACNKWFDPRPREQLCDGCVPVKVRVKRLALDGSTRTHEERTGAAGQGTQRSEVLGLTFKPGVPLWKVLALEAAARQSWGRK